MNKSAPLDQSVPALVVEVRRLVSILAGEGDPEKPLRVDTHLPIPEFCRVVRVTPRAVRGWIAREENPLLAHRAPGGHLLIVWGDWLHWRQRYGTDKDAAAKARETVLRLASR